MQFHGHYNTQGKPEWIEWNNARDRVLLYWLYVLTSRRFYKNVNFLLLFPDLLDEMNVSQKLGKTADLQGLLGQQMSRLYILRYTCLYLYAPECWETRRFMSHSTWRSFYAFCAKFMIVANCFYDSILMIVLVFRFYLD